MSARLSYSPDNRWVLECFDMQAYDPSDGTIAYLDGDATVQATVRRRNAGAAVTGETWPLALTYRSGSSGAFWAYLNDALQVNPKLQYEVLFQGDDGAGSTFKFVRELEVIDPRRGGD